MPEQDDQGVHTVAESRSAQFKHEIHSALSVWHTGIKQVDKVKYNSLQQLASDVRAGDTTAHLRAVLKAGQRQSATVRASWKRHCKRLRQPCKLFGHPIPLLTKLPYSQNLIRTNAAIQCQETTPRQWNMAHYDVEQIHLPEPLHDKNVTTLHGVVHGPPNLPGAVVQDGITVIPHITLQPLSAVPKQVQSGQAFVTPFSTPAPSLEPSSNCSSAPVHFWDDADEVASVDSNRSAHAAPQDTIQVARLQQEKKKTKKKTHS